MSSSLVLDIALMLFFAKLFEIPFRKYHINPVIAYVLAGFIISSNALKLVESSGELVVLVNFSIILLMLYTGLTTDFREIAGNFREIVLIGASGVLTTVSLTYLFLQIMGFNTYVSIFIAIVLSNTATETVAGILYRESDVYLKSIVIGASFVDDIIAVFFASVISSIGFREIGFIDLTIIVIKITLFLILSLYLVNILINKYSSIFSNLSKNYYWFVSLVITLAFTLAYVSKAIGLSEIIGAYIAGLVLARGREFHDPFLRSRITIMNFISDFIVFLDALFIPLFFVYIGLSYSITSIDINILVPIFLVAIIGKLMGIFPAAKYFFKNSVKALITSFLMTGRGLLEIVLLKIGYEIGIIDQVMYSTLLTLSLLTVITTPLLYTVIRKRMKHFS